MEYSFRILDIIEWSHQTCPFPLQILSVGMSTWSRVTLPTALVVFSFKGQANLPRENHVYIGAVNKCLRSSILAVQKCFERFGSDRLMSKRMVEITQLRKEPLCNGSVNKYSISHLPLVY